MADEATAPDALPRPTPAPTPGWGDYLEIFWAPGTVFRRRAESGFGVPLLVLVVATLVLYYITMGPLEPVLDAEFARGARRAIEQNPKLTLEQLNQMKLTQQKFGGLFLLVLMPLITVCLGLLVWIGGTLAGARQTYGQACTVATLAYFPRILESIVNAAQTVMLDEGSIKGIVSINLGPARFLDPDRDALLAAFLARVDVFTLWITALIAIGIIANGKGKVQPLHAWLVSAGIWLIGALPRILPVVLSSSE